MKKIGLFLFGILGFSFCFSQIIVDNYNGNIDKDTAYIECFFVDSLGKNTIGLNVFPIFGVLGGGNSPNTKIYIQYKRFFKNFNFRTSLNYINYYRPNNKIDLLNIDNDTVLLRRFNNNSFSYDFRSGVEAAFSQNNIRLFLGAAGIVGYKYLEENYYHYKRGIDKFPVERINFINLINSHEKGYHKTHFLKLGIDVSIGVDIIVSPNIIFTIQCTPELAFYNSFDQNIKDPDDYFSGPINQKTVFTPDFIDLIISVRF